MGVGEDSAWDARGEGPAMCRRRFEDEQIIGILKEAEAGGKTTTP